MIVELKTLAALAAFTTVLSVPSSEPKNVEWLYSFSEATQKAAEKDRLIMAYFWAEGSEYCAKLYQDTLSAADATPVMNRFVCFSAQHGEGTVELFERFAVKTLPSILFIDSNGVPEDLIQGYIPVEDFLDELDRIERGEGTLSGMRKAIAKAKKNSEDDLSTRLGLAGKLIELGYVDQHDELMDSIRQDDPKGKTMTGSRMLLSDIEQKLTEDGGGDEYPENWDLEPLYAHAKAMRLKEARFEAWNRIANLEIYKRNMPAAFDAFQTAWKVIPKEQKIDWSAQVSRWIIDSAEQRTSVEKKFALELAVAGNKLMEKQVKEMEDGSQEERNGYLAWSLNTLAWAHHINGNGPKAISTAKRCVALADSEKYRADLATFTQGF